MTRLLAAALALWAGTASAHDEWGWIYTGEDMDKPAVCSVIHSTQWVEATRLALSMAGVEDPAALVNPIREYRVQHRYMVWTGYDGRILTIGDDVFGQDAWIAYHCQIEETAP